MPAGSLVNGLETGASQCPAAAAKAGRSPDDIRRIYNVMGVITDGERGETLEGPAEYWADELTRLAQAERIDTFIFAPRHPTPDQITRFAEAVMPRVRAAV